MEDLERRASGGIKNVVSTGEPSRSVTTDGKLPAPQEYDKDDHPYIPSPSLPAAGPPPLYEHPPYPSPSDNGFYVEGVASAPWTTTAATTSTAAPTLSPLSDVSKTEWGEGREPSSSSYMSSADMEMGSSDHRPHDSVRSYYDGSYVEDQGSSGPKKPATARFETELQRKEQLSEVNGTEVDQFTRNADLAADAIEESELQSGSRPRLACPFHKKDPSIYRDDTCTHGFNRIMDVNQHLYRRHVKYICDRCGGSFSDESDLTAHQQQLEGCKFVPSEIRREVEGITLEQKALLHRRSNNKKDEVVLIEKDDEYRDGWVLVKRLSNGDSGLFPEVYTRLKIPRPTSEEYHKGKLHFFTLCRL